jgi:hypothetical protein
VSNLDACAYASHHNIVVQAPSSSTFAVDINKDICIYIRPALSLVPLVIPSRLTGGAKGPERGQRGAPYYQPTSKQLNMLLK